MSTEQERRPFAALAGGTVIGALGGLIRPGGAEFRLPLLLSLALDNAAFGNTADPRPDIPPILQW